MTTEEVPYKDGDVVFLAGQGRFGRVLPNGVNLVGRTLRVQPLWDGDSTGDPVIVEFEDTRTRDTVLHWMTG